MSVLYLSYATLLGLAVGSFLNVLIFRFHTGKTLFGRSFCTSCSHKIVWYDLVPVISFLFLRGKCRHCRAKISIQYPLVELVTGALYFFAAQALFLSGFSLESISRFIILLLVIPLLVAITAYDMRHKIIPDHFVYSFAFLALLFWFLDAFAKGFSTQAFLELAAGPLLFLPFFLLWYFSKGTLMGLGDGKLALGIGWMLGLSGGISAVVFGFWAGALVGLFLLFVSFLHKNHFFRKRFISWEVNLKSEIPFGPFLILGIFAVEFFSFSVFGWFI